MRQKAIRTRTDYDIEYRICRADNGNIRFFRSLGHHNPAGEIGDYVGTTIDITERKRAEEAREKLRQLEADLAHMNRVNMMGELAAALAHEIKQPITATVTNAGACLRFLEMKRPDILEAREAASGTVGSATRAAEIIDRVRALFKKTAPQWEPVNINELIREIALLLQNEIRRHSVAVHLGLAENLPEVMADRVQLQQVLMNLMLNAIEAMRGVTAHIEINSQLTDDGQLLIAVSDTGLGLPTEKADQIFDAFFTTKPQGTGMGLAISRSIVESHGGRLWASSNSGRGATFRFTLPYEESLKNMSTQGGATVFIVDDDADVRLSIQRLLKTVGLRAELFATAQDFLRRNIPDGPSCLVLDVRLPEMGGLEVQHKLAAAGINIPIIFVTAHGDIPMSVKAMKSGAVEFLTKPFRDQDLLDAIQQALKRHQLARRQQSEIVELHERHKSLTAREREVMELLVSGMQTKQIATALGTSEVTAAVHRGNVMRKMHAGSPAELGSMVERLRLSSNR